MYDTGAKQWREFATYPPKEAQKVNFYLSRNFEKHSRTRFFRILQRSE
jgi:predicted acyl esterase